MHWKIAAIGFGALTIVAGLAGVALAVTDTTCFGTANRDAAGNWVGGSYACNTADCPAPPSGIKCTQTSIGASTLHPGYNATICRCDGATGIACELVWYVKDDNPEVYFAGCPVNVCPGSEDCTLTPAAGAGAKTCACPGAAP